MRDERRRKAQGKGVKVNMSDPIVEYLKKNGIPVTRHNYIGLNWMGDFDPDEELPAELEADLPEELQWKPTRKRTNKTGL